MKMLNIIIILIIIKQETLVRLSMDYSAQYKY